MKTTKNIRPYIPKPTRREIFTIILLAIEIVFFSIVAKNFLSEKNFVTILRNSTDLAVVSIGMTMVMVLGGIDIL
jgi:ribose transport system permease protein/AI-2 transport system permease protein